MHVEHGIQIAQHLNNSIKTSHKGFILMYVYIKSELDPIYSVISWEFG